MTEISDSITDELTLTLEVRISGNVKVADNETLKLVTRRNRSDQRKMAAGIDESS